MRIRNMLNFDPVIDAPGERNVLPSLTVPDQSMSIREILDRHTRGLPIMGHKVPIFDEENDLPDLRTLDLAERQELREKYEFELAAIRQAAADRAAKKAEELLAKKAAASAVTPPTNEPPAPSTNPT